MTGRQCSGSTWWVPLLFVRLSILLARYADMVVVTALPVKSSLGDVNFDVTVVVVFSSVVVVVCVVPDYTQNIGKYRQLHVMTKDFYGILVLCSLSRLWVRRAESVRRASREAFSLKREEAGIFYVNLAASAVSCLCKAEKRRFRSPRDMRFIFFPLVSRPFSYRM